MLELPIFLTASLLVALATIGSVVSCFANYRKVPHVPGPFLASISPLWLIYHTIRGDVYLTLEDAFRKYGPVVRVAPNQVATNDVDTVRAIYSPRGNFIRGNWYTAMGLGADRHNVLTITDEKAHAMHRAKLLPGYSGKETNFEPAVDSMLTQMISLIRKDYTGGQSVLNFAQIASFFTLDVLTKVAFGLEVGFLRDNKDHYDYQKALAGFVPIMELGANSPTIFKLLNSKLVMSVAKPRPGDQIGQGALLGRAHAAVAEYFQTNEKDSENTMIPSFKRHGVTQPQCQDEAMLAILAGSDSTSTALRIAFLSTITNPHIYSKLNQEITDAVEKGLVSFPIITMAEAQTLPYLCAIIKESIRFFFPLHGLATHYSESAVKIRDHTIPPNTQIAIAFYAMNRNPEIYGADATQFRPERWIDTDEETLKRYERSFSLSFAAGTSLCLGKNLAMIELHKAIFELFRNFDFTIVNPLKPVTIRSYGVVLMNDIHVRVQAKQQLER